MEETRNVSSPSGFYSTYEILYKSLLRYSIIDMLLLTLVNLNIYRLRTENTQMFQRRDASSIKMHLAATCMLHSMSSLAFR